MAMPGQECPATTSAFRITHTVSVHLARL
jgi:hypothetical protein